MAGALAGALLLVAFVVLDLRPAPAASGPSRCLGQPSRGRLESGWKLPAKGPGFRVYSRLGWALGRTYVHATVHDVVLASYDSLHATHPELRFVYGETGLRDGGRFRPHRTHQAGTSVDFMTPMRDATGAPAALPMTPPTKWGYGINLDAEGRSGTLRIDLETLALHLAVLAEEARRAGAPIAKVVLYPPLRRRLAETEAWPRIADLPYTEREAWVRHDDHYHVDFAVPCAPLP